MLSLHDVVNVLKNIFSAKYLFVICLAVVALEFPQAKIVARDNEKRDIMRNAAG